jgi:FtsH-binding integral membrane protein
MYFYVRKNQQGTRKGVAMTSISTGLYDKRQRGVDRMTRRGFMLAISFFTTLNIMVAALGSAVSYRWEFTNDWLLLGFMIACTVVAILGAFLAHSHDDPMTSIVGGFICAGVMGLMVGPFVALYEVGSVLQAFVITTAIVFLTGFVGAVMPKDLSMWGAPLFAGLLGLLGLYLVAPLLGWLGLDYGFTVTVLDIVGIVLFSAIMVYDLNRASRLDKTLNNAIDVAVNVFLNFANIFIRILSAAGNRK